MTVDSVGPYPLISCKLLQSAGLGASPATMSPSKEEKCMGSTRRISRGVSCAQLTLKSGIALAGMLNLCVPEGAQTQPP